jgi:glucose dehydrogenase
MALRNPSGYRAFDDAALAAVEKALGGVAPGSARDGEVRTLWQLDATAYVVISPNPELVFDESTGKREWRYPLQKRVDHHVRLVAVY